VETAVLVRIHASYTAGRMKRKSRVNTLFRKLYGYNTFSNYSRYNRHKKGLVEEIPAVRYEGGLIMIRKGDLQRVTDLVKEYGAEYRTWEVVPDDEEKKQLQLQAV
jgi:hypothetical protein